ncbi:hypothetical protein KOJCDNHJ_03328 [Xanthomonas citri pv. punicae]|nr:hypothetical protein FICKIIDM_00078 [Xanthomonas citri pv. punicae]UIS29907.1 hypothetical protein KOJCDNHJ_03328 [Xanthomonas citri pv. punicae]CCF67779.1 hypothetical protein XAPC_1472 [Xanthomonas citri pv. punicae str. LMG 859]
MRAWPVQASPGHSGAERAVRTRMTTGRDVLLAFWTAVHVLERSGARRCFSKRLNARKRSGWVQVDQGAGRRVEGGLDSQPKFNLQARCPSRACRHTYMRVSPHIARPARRRTLQLAPRSHAACRSRTPLPALATRHWRHTWHHAPRDVAPRKLPTSRCTLDASRSVIAHQRVPVCIGHACMPHCGSVAVAALCVTAPTFSLIQRLY